MIRVMTTNHLKLLANYRQDSSELDMWSSQARHLLEECHDLAGSLVISIIVPYTLRRIALL